MTLAEASYPDELLYHAEHDWARVEGDEATFGITWYAQDASARSSSTTRRRSARRSSKDASYSEVESVKAVSDVIAPLSGEITAVNEALGTPPRGQRGPLRRGLAGEGQARRPVRGRVAAGAADYRRLLDQSWPPRRLP